MLAGLRVSSTLRARPVRMTPAIGSAKRSESWARSQTSPTLLAAAAPIARADPWAGCMCTTARSAMSSRDLDRNQGVVLSSLDALLLSVSPFRSIPAQ